MGKILRSIIPVSIFTALLLTIAMPSCNTLGCLENQSSIPSAGFFSYPAGEAIVVDSIRVYGIGAVGDSMLNTSIRAASVYLPFRAEKPSTSFAFRYLQRNLDFPSFIDTITFTYDSEPRFVSEDCGAMYFYRITKMTHTTHLIDSVSILDSLITNLDVQRIKIFFRTQLDEEVNAGRSLTTFNLPEI